MIAVTTSGNWVHLDAPRMLTAEEALHLARSLETAAATIDESIARTGELTVTPTPDGVTLTGPGGRVIDLDHDDAKRLAGDILIAVMESTGTHIRIPLLGEADPASPVINITTGDAVRLAEELGTP